MAHDSLARPVIAAALIVLLGVQSSFGWSRHKTADQQGGHPESGTSQSTEPAPKFVCVLGEPAKRQVLTPIYACKGR